MRLSLRPCLASTVFALLLACPQAQPGLGPTPGDGAPGPDDPRVVAATGELYAARALEELAAKNPAPETPSPGTGRPDETNGVCRLFAPELPNPVCCEDTLGFDVRAAGEICGLPVYLGESFHHTCGFYFVREAGTPARWFRMSYVRGDSPRQAAEEHVMLLHRTDPTAGTEPMPGVEGVWWVRQGEDRWAFLPGWQRVRILAWKSSACSDDKIADLVRQIVAAPEVVTGPRRNGLIPTFAPVPAPAASG